MKSIVRKILIADDDAITRKLTENVLRREGYDVTVCDNGTTAFEYLKESNGPKIAVLDWVMPGLSGLETCRKLKCLEMEIHPYLIMLTASKNEKTDILESFRMGANDYIEKPFEPQDFLTRLKIAEEMIDLQIALKERMKALEEAYEHIKTLQGILPICVHCHKIKNDDKSWERIEEYISKHTDAKFSHGLCPECMKRHYPEAESKK